MKSFIECVFVLEAVLLGAGFLYIDSWLGSHDQRQLEEYQSQQSVAEPFSYSASTTEALEPAPLRPSGRLVLAFLLGIIVISKFGVLYYLDRPFHTITDFLKRFSS